MGGSASSKSEQQPRVYVKSTTWERNTHNLFDYEASRALRKKVNKCQGNFAVCRTGPEIFVTKHDQISPESEVICLVKFEDGKYLIQDQQTPLGSDKPERVWKIVKFSGEKVSERLDQDGMILRKGDRIKLGRLEFLIRQLSFQHANPESGRLTLRNEVHTESDFEEEDSELPNEEEIVDVNQLVLDGPSQPTPRSIDSPNELICRICLEREIKDDPFISPCRCSGSMKFIHLSCLQKQLSSKSTTKDLIVGKVISFKQISCELCKEFYPPLVKRGKREIVLFRPQTPNYPHILLECQHGEKKPVLSKNELNLAFYDIRLDQGKEILKIGRGHDSDIRVTDISVSRVHALLFVKMQSKQLMLKDCLSKFGTLFGLRSEEVLKPTSPYYFQNGRTIYCVQVKVSGKSGCMCCGGKEQYGNLKIEESKAPRRQEEPQPAQISSHRVISHSSDYMSAAGPSLEENSGREEEKDSRPSRRFQINRSTSEVLLPGDHNRGSHIRANLQSSASIEEVSLNEPTPQSLPVHEEVKINRGREELRTEDFMNRRNLEIVKEEEGPPGAEEEDKVSELGVQERVKIGSKLPHLRGVESKHIEEVQVSQQDSQSYFSCTSNPARQQSLEMSETNQPMRD